MAIISITSGIELPEMALNSNPGASELIARKVCETRVLPGQRHAAFVGFVVISAVVYSGSLGTLLAYSFSHESCSHIVLIPLITSYLLYMEPKRFFGEASASVGPAVVLIVIGMVLYWFAGRRWSLLGNNANLSVAILSLVVIWIAGFLLCYGLRTLRVAVFPVLFLLLMVPLPDALLGRTVYLLQRGSTDIAYFLFNMVGVPVLRRGFLLSLPGVNIEVARECSGIRSSIALFITCLLAGHVYLRTPWKMTLFALLAFPLAVIKNGIRIVTLTLLSLYVDPSFLTGRLHQEGGFVFFLLGLALLLPGLLLLRKSEHLSESPRPAT